MTSIEYTPPDSPKWKSRSIVLEHPTDSDTLALIGNGKLSCRSDIKNILITGGAGFMYVDFNLPDDGSSNTLGLRGSWVTRHLTVQYPEYNIICFDKLDRVSSLANISCLRQLDHFTFIEGDITSVKAVSQTLSTHDVDCVMHFAASSHVQHSFEDAATFTHNNVIGTQILLDCVRRHGRVNRFVHVSTDEVYGETNGETVDETHQFLPTNPYSASKAAAEMYVHAYAKSFKISAIMIRSNNVYGPCQYPESKFSMLECIRPLSTC
jgi:dTDP-glucose 4,6-dehydratase